MRTFFSRMLSACLLALALHPSSVCLGAAAQDVAARCRTLTYSTNPNYPPYDWATGEDAFDGASIELLTMAAPPGVALRPIVLPWVRAQAQTKAGEIDLLVSLRITSERARYLVFTSHRAFPNPIVVFVRKDRVFPFQSLADLKDKRGGISSGDTFGGGFDEYWPRELNIEEAPDMENNFKKLDAGRIDYFVTSRYVGEAYAASHPSRHGIVSLSLPVSEQDIHFGFSRSSPCVGMVEEMGRRLKELDSKGIPEQLLRKHLRRIQEHAVMMPR
ncbi:MAG: transporter substrate-binding domain-containing protein [Humidesulfovibrio sp.]|nr:transporter substrate-binding domain-containing protein [Humidesulfovibrio sp.]